MRLLAHLDEIMATPRLEKSGLGGVDVDLERLAVQELSLRYHNMDIY